MKVLVVTGDAHRHMYFAREIAKERIAKVDIITGAKFSNQSIKKKFLRKFKRKDIRNNIIKIALNNFIFKRYHLGLINEIHSFEKSILTNECGTIIEPLFDLKKIKCSINEKRIVKIIRNNEYDLIVVFGSILVSAEFIAAAPLVINLHTGLSPYYRGANSNFWPFLNSEFNYCGFTVHKMSSGIDSGEILVSENISFLSEPSYGEANAVAIKKGTKAVVDLISRMGVGLEIKSVPQWTHGKVYRVSDYNYLQAYRYTKLKRTSSNVAPKQIKVT